MPSLAQLLDMKGRPVICDAGGVLTFANEVTSDASVFVATSVGGGVMLLEATDAPVRFAGNVSQILPLWPIPRPGGRLALGAQRYGEFLRFHEGTIQPSADVADAVEFSLCPVAGEDHDSVLSRIPQGITFDIAGLQTLFALGDPGMMPVVRALLSTLNVADVRLAWVHSPRTAVSDIFYPVVQEHCRARLPGFSAYTADLLRDGIEAFGWSIGERTYGAPMIFEAGRGKLTIGRYCSMANPSIILGNHNTRSATTYPFIDLWAQWPGTAPGLADHRPGDIVIGNDVWVGTQVVILPGSVIGDGAILGAGAVVRGKIPPYGICLGNPASVNRYRFDETTIARLLRLRWWDWPDAMVDRFVGLLLSEHIGRFLKTAEAELGLSTELI